MRMTVGKVRLFDNGPERDLTPLRIPSIPGLFLLVIPDPFIRNVYGV